jgi:hypothetical protein
MSDHDGVHLLDQRAMAAMYPQYFSQPGRPSTVASMVREQNDSATANMAMTPSFQGMLTPEQKKARDLMNALFADRYPLGQKLQSHTASSVLTARHHVAMTATIVQGNSKSKISSTLLAQSSDMAGRT